MLCGLALTSCATPAGPKLVERRWPDAPERPLVRWVGTFPDERAFGPPPSALRRVLDAIVGADGEAGRAAPPLLARPFGVAASERELVIADPDGQQVLVVDLERGTSRPLRCSFPWTMPLAVAAGPQGLFFVADGGRGKVARVAADGACTELGEGLFTRPSGLAVLGDRLYVADPPRHQVRFFSLDGAPLGQFGSHGEGLGQLNFPTALGATPEGELVVVDALNFRVVVTTREGEPVRSVGEAGERDGAFARPKGVAVDRRGRLYVADAQLGAVLVFDEQGRFRLAFNGSGREPYDLSMPAGLAVSKDTLFVADPYHHRVERYELLEDSP